MVKFPEFGSQIQAMNAASSNSTATVDFDDVPGWDVIFLTLKSFPNLTTWIFTFCTDDTEALSLCSQDVNELKSVLTCIDNELRKHPSLSKIHVCWFLLSSRQLAEKMLSLGWTVEDEWGLITEENVHELED